MAKDTNTHNNSTKVEAIGSKSKPLQPNPFTAYRDPETGKWMVVKLAPS